MTEDSDRVPRNIVVCCDGTSNEFAQDLTNVAKLTYALVKDEHSQHVYYQPGLGTRAAPGFTMPIGNWLARTAGLAFGYGLKDDVRDAYVFIMNHWRPGDRLYLFGFSRGAYTVRALAALIHMYGMAMPGNEALIPYAVRMLWRARLGGRKTRDGFALAKQFRESIAAAPCRPHFVGVWDTVSSVGWAGSPVSLPYTRSNIDIAHLRHAVSIDEHRAFFRTNLFAPKAGQDVIEVWFPGDHCDVGGGFPEAESGISKYALEWIAREGVKHQLLIDDIRLSELLGETPGSLYTPKVPTAKLHLSMPWKWWIAEIAPKAHWNRTTVTVETRFNLFRRRSMGTAPKVHTVAWDVTGEYFKRLPSDAVRYTP